VGVTPFTLNNKCFVIDNFYQIRIKYSIQNPISNIMNEFKVTYLDHEGVIRHIYVFANSKEHAREFVFNHYVCSKTLNAEYTS
jgi:hypothetical protein